VVPVPRSGASPAVVDLVGRCHAGLDAPSLLSEFTSRVGAVVPVDAVFCATVDPDTMLFTGSASREIPEDLAGRFLANELLEPDVNKFTALASSADPVDWLDRATAGDRLASPRYREIMAPAGLGDELRAAVRSGGACWGVVCLHREDRPSGFTPIEAAVVRRLARHLGDGLRRALLVAQAAEADEEDSGAPGVLLVGDDGSLVATTPAGERWLWELSGPADGGGLPGPVAAVIARLQAIRSTPAPARPPRVRVRTRSGGWAVIHAAEVRGLTDNGVAVVVEAARPPEVAPLVLLAHGLTEREAQVAALALRDRPTKLIARELQISINTVEHHFKRIFDKVGVASRGELRARVFSEQRAP
jgi:DNA-binding CsgD family transcriptional regulator